MASKRKQEARAKRLARKHSQAKPGGASKYALKRRRMFADYENPRSPIRTSESIATVQSVAPGCYDVDDLASEILRAAKVGS